MLLAVLSPHEDAFMDHVHAMLIRLAKSFSSLDLMYDAVMLSGLAFMSECEQCKE